MSLASGMSDYFALERPLDLRQPQVDSVALSRQPIRTSRIVGDRSFRNPAIRHSPDAGSPVLSLPILSPQIYGHWVEEFRTELLRQVWLEAEPEVVPVVQLSEIKVWVPVQWAGGAVPATLDQPMGRIWFSNLGRQWWTVKVRFSRGQQTIATATQRGYHLNLVTMRPVEIPDPLVQVYWDSQWSL